MEWLDWYNSLNKPDWTPAPKVIGTIWSILYPIIFVSFGFVFWKALTKQIPAWIAFVFAINLIANLIFSPIQFNMRNLPLASLDIIVVLVTLAIGAISMWSHFRWVSLAQVPYLIWVSIATVLQISITLSNR